MLCVSGREDQERNGRQMRVIAGSARRLQLKTIEGLETRPTTDRIKETLFNMLSFEIEGSRFLDLFSGSGGIGIEALSRGAREAVFVEQNRKAAACIRQNLEHTRLSDRAELIIRDAVTALRMMEGRQAFDYIFMDPPYGRLLERDVLLYLDQSDLCDSKSLLIVEADLETEFDYLDRTDFEIVREKEYKTNRHIFLRRRS